jgi:DNA-binding response OmpR family regulator
MTIPNAKLPSVLLVDDDPVFTLILEANAHAMGIELTACAGLEEMLEKCHSRKFDAVVMDYHLGDKLGTEIAERLGRNTPVVLVSYTGAWLRDANEWPANITKFVHKNKGGVVILEEVLRALRNDRPRWSPEALTQKPFF